MINNILNFGFTSLKSKACKILGVAFVLALSFDVSAQETIEPAVSPEVAYILNTFLFLVCGFLVMFMAAGFCMLEAGQVRSKNTAVICLKNMWRDLANQPKWLPRLIIEHRGKMQFLAYNSKTEALRENLTGFNCLSGQDLSALMFSHGSDNPLLGYCPELVILRKFCRFLLLS